MNKQSDSDPSSSAKRYPARALLIIDMISSWDFPDAEVIARGAIQIAPRIGALQRRCRDLQVPVIFANDNRGKWRSDFREVVAASKASEHGAAITRHIEPVEEDYFVLKPRHSAFYATPLEILLHDLRIKELLVTGVTTDQCVLATVSDAHMRDFDIQVMADCTATLSETRQRQALVHLTEVVGVHAPPSTQAFGPG